MALSEKIRVSRSEFFRELGLVSGKVRRRKALRSEYFSHLGYLSGLAREIRRLEERRRRYPPISIIEKEIITRRLASIAKERGTHIFHLSRIRKILADLRDSLERERARIRLKVIPPPPPKRVLHRIKIRLYNMQRKPTPTGMFQGFFDVDALIDPETELVDWDFWLTKEEVNIAKYHFVGYFKGMAKWRAPDQVTLAYFDDPEGIPHTEETVRYKRTGQGVPYAKNVPPEFITRAEGLTVGELIVGESSVDPTPNPDPKPENMGVYVQKFMVIDADGVIKWHETREKWAWHPTEAMVTRVKEELKSG